MAFSSSSIMWHLSFLSWVILILPLSSLSQPSNNITLGSSLSTIQENPSWLSPSREFAFGLYRLPNKDLFLLAIWFYKIPQQTVVWSANGDKPVQRGSILNLTDSGQLVLYDNQSQEIWKPNISAPAAMAAMLDTGEFVLKGLNSSRIWGTFNHPTDTILPTQKLDQNSSLFSRRAEDDYSNGRFQLRLLEDGNLSLYTGNVLTGYTSNTPYNRNGSESRSLGNGFQLLFDEKGYIGVLQRNGTISNLSMGESFSPGEFYQRATIDLDGVFRKYVYRKTGRTEWDATGGIPSDLCTAVISYPGSGVCGFNSYCKLDKNRSPRCECPTGYSYLKPNTTLEGCKPNFTAESCNPDGFGNEKLLFELEEMPNTTWILADFEQYYPVREELCRRSCLIDCLCAVVVFDNGTCSKKRLPLSNGRAGPGITAKTFVKVLKRNLSLEDSPHPDSCKGKKDQATLVHVGSALLGSSGFLNFLLGNGLLNGRFREQQRRITRDLQRPN
ncbi:hypothetical protein MRB53_005331 [Persea americana]|uniref:Uncharacterized protein n=1 Tax=Persea americana TaxID=3435 RepID=A0ACC2MD83_PERAE|nr:hypothetical protein MRB53_005331 [Persea americana]